VTEAREDELEHGVLACTNQIQPALTQKSEIPPTKVGGLLTFSLWVGLEVLNPTNESWWKLHFQPKTMAGNEQSTNSRWWD